MDGRLLVRRKVYQNDRSGALLRAHPQASAMKLDQGPRNGEAKPRPLMGPMSFRLNLLEGLAELVDGLPGNADPVVLHVDIDGARRRPRAHDDAAVLRGELHGVLEQVDENL